MALKARRAIATDRYCRVPLGASEQTTEPVRAVSL
jgi:hypothetical protein